MNRRLPDLPAPQAVEAWFRSVYDPTNQKGNALILDPAFRDAFRKVMSSEIENSGLSPALKTEFKKEIEAFLEDLQKKVPPHSPDEPLPSEMRPEAIAGRTAGYEAALRDFLLAERFRGMWKNGLRANVTFDQLETATRDYYLRNFVDGSTVDPKQLHGTAPAALHELTRETLRQVALDRITKAYLPESEKVRLRSELEKALDAWEREQNLRAHHLPKLAKEEKDDLELSPVQQRELKKTLDEYLRSETFRRCISQPLQLLAISESITALGAIPTTVMIQAYDGKAQWSDMFRGGAYVDAIGSAELQKQLARNAVLMTSIGGLRCVHLEAFGGNNRLMRWALRPNNFNGYLLSPISATIAELSAGQFRPSTIFLSAFWTRVISVNKTQLANKLSEDWRKQGKPNPALFYGVAQFVSEMTGAVGFPWLSRMLFGPAPDDDDKKKKKEKEADPLVPLQAGQAPAGPIGRRPQSLLFGWLPW